MQVIVFADRIEVWNPGELPRSLTPEKLREPHGPVPRNPLLAEPLFRVKLVEKAGTGTTDMIAYCRAVALPEPTFEQHGPHFVTTVWRNWLTAAVMDELGLNDRQRAAVKYAKTQGRITNSEYQHLVNVSRKTAMRDLGHLVDQGVFALIGFKRGAHYAVTTKK